MAKRNKPVHVAKSGNVRVPVYAFAPRAGEGKNYKRRFCVLYRRAADAAPKRETFSDKKKAVDRADEMAIAIANGQADVLELTSATRDSHLLTVRDTEPFGVPPHVATAEWAAAKRKLGSHSINEAVDFFLRSLVQRPICPPTTQILADLLVRLHDERRDGKYVGGIEDDLTKFAAAFPDLGSASEEKIRVYLSSLVTKPTRNQPSRPVSARRRDNVRNEIVTLFLYAKEKEFLPPDQRTEAEKISRINTGSEITTYSPKELALLLNHVSEEWMPWLAISAFAGLRTSEIFRLRWSNVKFEQRVISVPRKIAKKIRISRQVPMSDTLLSWLAPWRESVGLLFADAETNWRRLESQHSRELSRMRKATGISTPNNACRHSFGSHRLAVIKNEDQLALEMGTSVAKIREHYNDPKPEDEALAYFGITRHVADNVLSLPLEFEDPHHRAAR